MKVISDLNQWREARATLEAVGFVPTMGALHQGHAALLAASVAANEVTVLSIYVNPTQFNNASDLASYPDMLAEDLQMAEQLGVDYVLVPDYADLYPDDFRFKVTEDEYSGQLCGANRPGHFTGVLTVVMKLLNLVQPQRAYFGKKDYQQLELVREMSNAFFMDVEIVGVDTVRERDGLAMSSRNQLLDARGRALAGRFNGLLRKPGSDEQIKRALTQAGFSVDYVQTRGGRRFGAVVIQVGEREVRLIDNIDLSRGERAA